MSALSSLSVLAGTVLLLSAGFSPVFADKVNDLPGIQMLAEYRADHDLDRSATLPDWNAEVATSSKAMRGGQQGDEPWDLQTQEVLGSVERNVVLGSVTLRGALDIRHLRAHWTGELYSEQHSVQLGPKLFFGPGNVTHLYYGIDQQDWAGHRFGRGGDADTTRTGLAHTWSWGDQAHVRVGYEYAQGSNEELYQDMQGHSIRVSGRFPVGWGLQAKLLADYGRYNYPQYSGTFGVVSDRREFRASLSRSFGERLSGDLHYSYYDEDFGPANYAQRRSAFGLHLRYRY